MLWVSLSNHYIIRVALLFRNNNRSLKHSLRRGFNTATIKMAATRRSARLSSQGMPPPTIPPSKQSSRKRKASPQSSNPRPEAPSTPKKRNRATNTSAIVPPFTPTPSAVGLMAEPSKETPSAASSQDPGQDVTSPSKKKYRVKAATRLANPNSTNAPLLSPETSRLIASRRQESMSPSKLATSEPRLDKQGGVTTTENLLQEANDHLIGVDERMRSIIEKNHCRPFSPEGLAEKIDPFESLASGIISQQVSGAAAKSIKAKFVALFDNAALQPAGRFPSPSAVTHFSLEKLRTAGLSQRKAEYIMGLAEKFKSSELTAQMLHDAPYDEVLEKLIAVRGLGRWSVEMFLCFGLKRMDVFSLGDLGIQRGMAAWVGRDVAKLKNKGGKWKYMSEQEMTEISDRFKPYRSLFMWYMWRVEETDVSTME